MSDTKLILLVISAFFVYVMFAVGLLAIKKRMSHGRAVKPIILAPIILCFFAGMGILLYALTQL